MSVRTELQRLLTLAVVAVAALAPASVTRAAGGLGVEVWTDRGSDGVYQPGDRIEIEARTSANAYLLVYEIDSEGFVRVLFPERGNPGFVEAGRKMRLPSEHSDMDLVVQDPVGEGYIVAVASIAPFGELPWYLRPYDPRAEAIGFEGAANDEEGITAEGQIVGDPFVAMERIRRRIVKDSDNLETFSTSYTSYYVHERVKYPRYVCYDCHRPGYWSWWSGFDPYYTTCSVFTVRANWGWYWGPSYWCGYVPYYVYAYRPDCPPHYRPAAGITYSAWNGWAKWNALWGGQLVRYKSEPPASYAPPSAYRADRGYRDNAGKLPPGFLVADQGQGVRGSRMLATGRMQDPSNRGRTLDAVNRGVSRSPVDRGGVQGRRPAEPGDGEPAARGTRTVRGQRGAEVHRTPRGAMERAPGGRRIDAPSRPAAPPAPREVDRSQQEAKPAPAERAPQQVAPARESRPAPQPAPSRGSAGAGRGSGGSARKG